MENENLERKRTPLEETYPDINFHRALRFSPLITIMERHLDWYCRFFIKLIMRPKFCFDLKPSREIVDFSWSKTGSFGVTYVENENEKLWAERIIKREDQDTAGIAVYWRFISDTFRKSGVIPEAEDPRVFRFQNNCYIYYQRFIPNQRDCEIFVFRPKDSKCWKINSPFQVSGKNWSPYEYQGELRFIYSYFPEIILELKIDENSNVLTPEVVKGDIDFKPVWGDEFNSFGQVRGGSPLVMLSNGIYLGFTHITPIGLLKESHRLGLVTLNPKNQSVRHYELTRSKNRLLVDAFSFTLRDNQVIVDLAVTSGKPGMGGVLLSRQRWRFELKELMKLVLDTETDATETGHEE